MQGVAGASHHFGAHQQVVDESTCRVALLERESVRRLQVDQEVSGD